jgi:hypothetical protein
MKNCLKRNKLFSQINKYFYKNKSRKSGWSNWCKNCWKQYSAERYKVNKHKHHITNKR